MTNTAITGATFEIDGGQQLVDRPVIPPPQPWVAPCRNDRVEATTRETPRCEVPPNEESGMADSKEAPT